MDNPSSTPVGPSPDVSTISAGTGGKESVKYAIPPDEKPAVNIPRQDAPPPRDQLDH